ncbi:hypothetical protein MCEZE9_00025 [Candidatus Nanopelagicaceae bacterium]
MKIYSHRINSRSELERIPAHYGVEIDLRSQDRNLILAHDPFVGGELFSDWLKSWKGQSLILNVKEDSLENAIIEALNPLGISDYFFLDQNYPSIRRTIAMGVNKLATRVSDFEDLDTCLKSGSEWVWLDSFSGDWSYLPTAVRAISQNGQKSCLVSPELQRGDESSEMSILHELIRKEELIIDGVCTKFAKSWEV